VESTELEGCVLGIVWERGPCTAYVIRTVFLESLSPYWSGSAGSIYPLVARLEARGLVAARVEPRGGRSRKELSITPEGLGALHAWLRPLPEWTGPVPVDPVRTRMFFLGALPPEEQEAFVADAEAKARAGAEALRKEHQAALRRGEAWEARATRGAILVQAARIEWLAEVRREIQGLGRG
jgi:DNA-binding PadR family transcriptional regulator